MAPDRPRAAPRLHTLLCDLLGCTYPILQAGMGGVARAELVAATVEAGAYGFLGMVREPPDLIRREIAAVRERTDRPFGVNVIPYATDADLLDAQLAVCFEAGVDALTLFWDVRADVIARARDAGCKIVYQVGSVADAVSAAEAGADAIIAQGVEAGGHVRGTTSALALVPRVVDAVDVPVVACGGITDGRGLAAALALGAAGVHCGSVFLATRESFAHDYHKQRLVEAETGDTVLTDAYVRNWPTGAPVRVLRNSRTEALKGQYFGHDPNRLPDDVIGIDEGKPIPAYSTDSPLRTTEGRFEEMALFAGQGVGGIDAVRPAADVVHAMAKEANAILACLGGSV